MLRPAVPFALLAGAAAAQTPPATDPLPAGPGHDTMVKVCSGCHAPTVAAEQRHDRAGWQEIVETMASRGLMASDAQLNEIVDYLTARFPASSGSAPPPAKPK